MSPSPQSAVSLRDASLSYGDRVLWNALDLDVAAGKFLAVLGPNGSGKSSLLKVLLGLTPLTAGSGEIAGAPLRKGNPHVGYVPQQRGFDTDVPLRARDLVGFTFLQFLCHLPVVLLLLWLLGMTFEFEPPVTP